MTDFIRPESWVQHVEDLSAPKATTTELKPCPFCGKPVRWEETMGENDIVCGTMGCYLEYGAGWTIAEEDVAAHEERWNWRKP